MPARRVRIYPYKLGSKSAKALKEQLIEFGVDALCVKRDGDYRPRPTDLIVNWGAGYYTPDWKYDLGQMLNQIKNIGYAVDKIETFKRCIQNRIEVPEFTSDILTAMQWQIRGEVVLARQNEGRDGRGLELFAGGEALPRADFYVKMLDIREEWRIGVFQGRYISSQFKVPTRELQDDYEKFIRVTRTGWGFSYDHRPTPIVLREAAIEAVEALGLDFGGVDVGLLGDNSAVVLEVNTAPELSPLTAKKYAQAIMEVL
jgi:hypothetical protein